MIDSILRGLRQPEYVQAFDVGQLQSVGSTTHKSISTWRGMWVDYAKFRSRSHRAVVRVYDDACNVIETHEHAGDLKE